MLPADAIYGVPTGMGAPFPLGLRRIATPGGSPIVSINTLTTCPCGCDFRSQPFIIFINCGKILSMSKRHMGDYSWINSRQASA